MILEFRLIGAVHITTGHQDDVVPAFCLLLF